MGNVSEQLHIYNTMTRKKEPFQPLEAGKVKMYVCGPTVYDYIHIGNARPLIFFDVVRRYLMLDHEVTFVLNFTDVDDKLIQKARETGKEVPEIAEQFIAAYFKDARALGIKDADVHPRVTENMDEIIDFIARLIEKGHAYESGGDVYFRTSSFPEYGKLSGQKMDQLMHGARVEVSEKKEDARDFVLWKQAKPSEISWPSPWGNGRPGWHIECSTMVHKFLGQTIDIHGGGSDLIFPHHECEVAQSESLNGQPLARYWMHNGYIHINNEKMSKSLGNGVNVNEILARYKPQALRYLMLATHYRNPLHFSEEAMKQAEQSVARIDNCVHNLRFRQNGAIPDADDRARRLVEKAEQFKREFCAHMNDDFNTPDALTVMFEAVNTINPYLQEETVHQPVIEAYLKLFSFMDSILGLLPESEDTIADAEVERLIKEREQARKQRDFQRADEIRATLLERGIVLEDTPQGTRWKRK
jgi:cysteinyl-tRNA synthetase